MIFGCKCCKVLKEENEHLRKWIDRLMERKAPSPDVDASPQVVDEDIFFQTQE